MGGDGDEQQRTEHRKGREAYRHAPALPVELQAQTQPRAEQCEQQHDLAHGLDVATVLCEIRGDEAKAKRSDQGADRQVEDDRVHSLAPTSAVS